MKVLIVAFLALAVGASAFPQEYELEDRALQRNIIVENRIKRMIEALSESMRANGLDPFQIKRMRIENSPAPGVHYDLFIQNMKLLGASDIQILELIWNTFGSRLRMIVVLPSICFSTGESSLGVNYHGNKFKAEGSGEFIMERLTVSLDIRVSFGMNNISIRSVDASMRIGSLRSAANLVMNGKDYSDRVNTFINKRVPRWIWENQNTIDLVLSEAIKRIGNAMLENR